MTPPWAIQDLSGHALPGNGPSNFIAAWRHVHHVVAVELDAQGVSPSQVQWVLAPGAHNWPDQAGNQIADYYPGPSYVDVLGMDGYNWGGSGWRSFQQLFDSGYQALTALDPNLPLMLAEFASDPNGGDRAAWIQNAARALSQSYPRIVAFNWFDEGHWALSNSDGSYAAFASAFPRDRELLRFHRRLGWHHRGRQFGGDRLDGRWERRLPERRGLQRRAERHRPGLRRLGQLHRRLPLRERLSGRRGLLGRKLPVACIVHAFSAGGRPFGRSSTKPALPVLTRSTVPLRFSPSLNRRRL